jgi:AAA15 family ATPase/GTPase
MLRSFRLANHKSVRHEQELVLLPVYDHGRPVQPVTAIYGANASGKSNLLDGLAFMEEAVRSSYARWEPNSGIPRKPFRLDPAARDEPSHFVVDLELDGVRYTYGFAVDDHVVREEWLYSYPERKRRVVFERTGGDIKFGSTVSARKGKAGILEELTRPNALFLSLASQVNFAELMPVYEWFTQMLMPSEHARRIKTLDFMDRIGAQFAPIYENIVDLLKFADIGISDVAIVDVENPTGLTKELRFIHSACDDQFELHDESAGTRTWLTMVTMALLVMGIGGTLVVDEIDSSLHPRLTARLMALFQDETTNPNQAQLVCTTHDTTLLSPILGEQVLIRDQVWFTEKNEAGETNLYPLSDFSPRKGENIERRYLGGSYGAVPRIVPEDLMTAMRGRPHGAMPLSVS